MADHQPRPGSAGYAAPSMDLLEKSSLTVPELSDRGHLHLVEIIGETAYGVVYRCHFAERADEMLVLRVFRLSDPAEQDQFKKDAQALAGLDHPNVVKTIAGGVLEGNNAYLLQEFIEGPTLAAFVAEHGIFWERLAVQILRDAADALKAARARGLAHISLKPENIFLEPLPGPEKDHSDRFSYTVKVADIGVARYADRWDPEHGMPEDRAAEHTLIYAAPERWDDARTENESLDVYSLGGILFHMLTEWPPFKASSFSDLIARKREAVPSPRREVVNTDVIVERIVHEAMLPSPTERLGDLDELIGRCDKAIGELPKRESIRRFDRKLHKAITTGFAIGIFVIIVSGAVGLLVMDLLSNAPPDANPGSEEVEMFTTKRNGEALGSRGGDGTASAFETVADPGDAPGEGLSGPQDIEFSGQEE